MRTMVRGCTFLDMTSLDDAKRAQADVRRYERKAAEARAVRDEQIVAALDDGNATGTVASALGIAPALVRKIAATRRDPDMTTTTQTREARLRRQADRQGYALSKVRESDRNFHQYGPWMLVDRSTTGVVAPGLSDLDDVERELLARTVEGTDQ